MPSTAVRRNEPRETRDAARRASCAAEAIDEAAADAEEDEAEEAEASTFGGSVVESAAAVAAFEDASPSGDFRSESLETALFLERTAPPSAKAPPSATAPPGSAPPGAIAAQNRTQSRSAANAAAYRAARRNAHARYHSLAPSRHAANRALAPRPESFNTEHPVAAETKTRDEGPSPARLAMRRATASGSAGWWSRDDGGGAAEAEAEAEAAEEENQDATSNAEETPPLSPPLSPPLFEEDAHFFAPSSPEGSSASSRASFADFDVRGPFVFFASRRTNTPGRRSARICDAARRSARIRDAGTGRSAMTSGTETPGTETSGCCVPAGTPRWGGVSAAGTPPFSSSVSFSSPRRPLKIVPSSSPFSSSPFSSSPSSSSSPNPSPALAMTTTASANHHGATFPGPPAGRAQSPTISASSVGGKAATTSAGGGIDLVHLERRPGSSSGSRGPPPPAARRATFASEDGSRPGFAARASSFVGSSSSS